MIKRIWPLWLTAIAAFCVIGCGQVATEVAEKTDGGFRFAVLRYDSAALEYRLDSIHNRGLVLQFITRQTGDNNSHFQLISYAYDTLNDYNNSWMPDTLEVAETEPLYFSGKAALGNNGLTREQLLNVVRDDSGTRFPYDYLRFQPMIEGVFGHVVYQVRAYKNGQPVPGTKTQVTSPLPPARVWE